MNEFYYYSGNARRTAEGELGIDFGHIEVVADSTEWVSRETVDDRTKSNARVIVTTRSDNEQHDRVASVLVSFGELGIVEEGAEELCIWLLGALGRRQQLLHPLEAEELFV